LLPAYWVVALVAVAIYGWIYQSSGAGFFADWKELTEHGQWSRLAINVAANATLIGINYQSPLVVPPAWTLGVELMFYALAPLLVRRSAWLIAAVMAASVALRFAYLLASISVHHQTITASFRTSWRFSCRGRSLTSFT
jgi:peptidoglycan/LPS O-acetylase OafA/YrhL